MEALRLEKLVLILDDDIDFCDEIAAFLRRYHLNVMVAHKPADAERILQEEEVGILLLDVMLPDKHGFEYCKEIREKMAQLPILFVSAYCDSFEQILGFEAGADDFLVKPFLPQELLARMKAVLRRTQADSNSASKSEIVTRNGLRINTILGQVWLDGKRIKLPTFQYELLAYFAQNPQRPITRTELMENIHSYSADAITRSIDINVSRIRKALGESTDNPRFIRTIWRKGYYFIDEVL